MQLRGFFADNFGNWHLLHQHLPDGGLRYRTPLIQYKILMGEPFVLGINEGADILQQIFPEITHLKVGTEEYDITEKRLFIRTDEFGTTADFIPYAFLTPWLALNQENYEAYQKYGSWQKRRELLSKILVGNILSIAKGINYTVTEPITVKFDHLRETRTTLKGTPMLGFLGDFQINFAIPEYWGIGKSVARGFGTIARCSW